MIKIRIFSDLKTGLENRLPFMTLNYQGIKRLRTITKEYIIIKITILTYNIKVTLCKEIVVIVSKVVNHVIYNMGVFHNIFSFVFFYFLIDFLMIQLLESFGQHIIIIFR